VPGKKDILTVGLNARDLEFQVYTKLNELKKRGKFSSWSVFLKWLVNNKSISETFIDEIEKRVKTKREEVEIREK
jgi:hypothetical protein